LKSQDPPKKPVKSRNKIKALPEYIVPCREPVGDRGVYPFETVPIHDHETYSLDSTIARFILPRLKRYRVEISCGLTWGCFSEFEDGKKRTTDAVDGMIAAFQIIASDDYWHDKYDSEKGKTLDAGMDLFHKYFYNLWF